MRRHGRPMACSALLWLGGLLLLLAVAEGAVSGGGKGRRGGGTMATGGFSWSGGSNRAGNSESEAEFLGLDDADELSETAMPTLGGGGSCNVRDAVATLKLATKKNKKLASRLLKEWNSLSASDQTAASKLVQKKARHQAPPGRQHKAKAPLAVAKAKAPAVPKGKEKATGPTTGKKGRKAYGKAAVKDAATTPLKTTLTTTQHAEMKKMAEHETQKWATCTDHHAFYKISRPGLRKQGYVTSCACWSGRGGKALMKCPPAAVCQWGWGKGPKNTYEYCARHKAKWGKMFRQRREKLANGKWKWSGGLPIYGVHPLAAVVENGDRKAWCESVVHSAIYGAQEAADVLRGVKAKGIRLSKTKMLAKGKRQQIVAIARASKMLTQRSRTVGKYVISTRSGVYSVNRGHHTEFMCASWAAVCTKDAKGAPLDCVDTRKVLGCYKTKDHTKAESKAYFCPYRKGGMTKFSKYKPSSSALGEAAGRRKGKAKAAKKKAKAIKKKARKTAKKAKKSKKAGKGKAKKAAKKKAQQARKTGKGKGKAGKTGKGKGKAGKTGKGKGKAERCKKGKGKTSHLFGTCLGAIKNFA